MNGKLTLKKGKKGKKTQLLHLSSLFMYVSCYLFLIILERISSFLLPLSNFQ